MIIGDSIRDSSGNFELSKKKSVQEDLLLNLFILSQANKDKKLIFFSFGSEISSEFFIVLFFIIKKSR